METHPLDAARVLVRFGVDTPVLLDASTAAAVRACRRFATLEQHAERVHAQGAAASVADARDALARGVAAGWLRRAPTAEDLPAAGYAEVPWTRVAHTASGVVLAQGPRLDDPVSHVRLTAERRDAVARDLARATGEPLAAVSAIVAGTSPASTWNLALLACGGTRVLFERARAAPVAAAPVGTGLRVTARPPRHDWTPSATGSPVEALHRHLGRSLGDPPHAALAWDDADPELVDLATRRALVIRAAGFGHAGPPADPFLPPGAWLSPPPVAVRATAEPTVTTHADLWGPAIAVDLTARLPPFPTAPGADARVFAVALRQVHDDALILHAPVVYRTPSPEPLVSFPDRVGVVDAATALRWALLERSLPAGLEPMARLAALARMLEQIAAMGPGAFLDWLTELWLRRCARIASALETTPGLPGSPRAAALGLVADRMTGGGPVAPGGSPTETLQAAIADYATTLRVWPALLEAAEGGVLGRRLQE